MQIDRGTLLELLLKAGVEWHGVHAEPDGDKTLWKGDIEKFAKLVAEHSASVEREACAKVADTYEQASNMKQSPGFALLAKECAAAIRARNNNA